MMSRDSLERGREGGRARSYECGGWLSASSWLWVGNQREGLHRAAFQAKSGILIRWFGLVGFNSGDCGFGKVEFLQMIIGTQCQERIHIGLYFSSTQWALVAGEPYLVGKIGFPRGLDIGRTRESMRRCYKILVVSQWVLKTTKDIALGADGCACKTSSSILVSTDV